MEMRFHARRLIDLREKLGLTQHQFAIRIGMQAQHVSQWERGESEPRLSTLLKILNEFDLPADYFFDPDYHHSSSIVTEAP